MNLRSLVWNELRERPWSVVSSSIAILLGVAALVAIRHVTVHSEQEVSRQLSSLGANILILPRDASLQNYYAADRNGLTLPEEHVVEVLMAGLPGVEKVTPKLSMPAKMGGLDVTLTGILPQSAGRIRDFGHRGVTYVGTLSRGVDVLAETAVSGDAVMTLGAGSVWQAGDALLSKLEARS